MSVYLHDIPLDQARIVIRQALDAAGLWTMLGSERINLDEYALGRVLAEPLWAVLSSPHYHASAMDGFAVRAEETAGAMPTHPVSLQYARQALYVDTGDALPGWADAVVPIEQVEPLGERNEPAHDLRRPHFIRIRAALTPWMHVRPMGEDIVASQLVLPAGQVLRAVDLGAAGASGHTSLVVSRKPRVAILPTGTELVGLGRSAQAGQIIETNSIILAALLRSWGAEVQRFPITPDDFDQIKARTAQAAEEFDLVLVNAGSSAGSEDFTAGIVESLGQVLIHGVAVRPGHPVIFGMLDRTGGTKVPVIGVPGYPVSAALTAEIFIEPLLARWLGRTSTQPVEISAQLTRKVTSPPGDDDYLRVVTGRVGERMLAAPLSRGAGVITSMVRADGIVILPSGSQGLEAGTQVKVRLYRSQAELENTIFATGSHDMTLDLLAQYLANGSADNRFRRLVSSNVGSQGGLIALRKSEAHLAGTHLLDPESGQYNLSAIAQYLAETPVSLIHWVEREQGLMFRPGNPKKIRDLSDLARPDVRFVNRQRGAGTRVLLDYHLQQLGVPAESVKGYRQEEFTHLAVAAAVASERADCGLGIPAAAKALGLDFIGLYEEQYDLAIPCYVMRSGLLDPIFDLMISAAFRKAVQEMPGYKVTHMGDVVLKCPSP